MLTEGQEDRTQLIALSVDSPEDLKRMVDKVSGDGQSPRFPFLTDPGHKVIDRYGLFNPDDPRGRQITHPATYVIDRDGIVRWRHVEVDYTVRPTNEDILRALEEID